MKFLNLLFAAFGVALLAACDTPAANRNDFNVDAALANQYALDFYRLGPKPFRSKELQASAEWIVARARQYTQKVAIIDCGHPGEGGTRNVEAIFPGRDDKHFVVIGTHFDTKRLFSFPDFAGANDSASGVGAQLAMMQTLFKLSSKQLPCTVRFLFFDGEECLYNYSDTDGLHGSRAYVDMLLKNGDAANCRGMILLDMIGDRDLIITPPQNGDAKLIDAAVKAAARLGHPERVQPDNRTILDDHLPFFQAKIPCIDLIDFSYGPNNIYWHTSADTPDKLSAESIQFSAELAFQLYWYLATDRSFAR